MYIYANGISKKSRRQVGDRLSDTGKKHVKLSRNYTIYDKNRKIMMILSWKLLLSQGEP